MTWAIVAAIYAIGVCVISCLIGRYLKRNDMPAMADLELTPEQNLLEYTWAGLLFVMVVLWPLLPAMSAAMWLIEKFAARKVFTK